MISREKIIQLIEERIAEHDQTLYLVNLKINPGNIIQVEIDKENGYVSIDDCVAVSRNIEHNLDRDAEDFELEVSSAGLDQPLRMYKQYIKNIGQKVKIKLPEKGSVEGEIKSADQNGFVIETKEKKTVEGRRKKEWVVNVIPLRYDEIKETKLILSF
ncbi:MAG: ribosome assembly cofactor RimP [Crocinitomicaceae bacterium]|nr:ribosome assembly cofactor RimP [Crocinitomicaceae bacterium]MBK8927485.1 ribosome assembly cofactor RimP [Crocinitomicaceae bacterium]